MNLRDFVRDLHVPYLRRRVAALPLERLQLGRALLRRYERGLITYVILAALIIIINGTRHLPGDVPAALISAALDLFILTGFWLIVTHLTWRWAQRDSLSTSYRVAQTESRRRRLITLTSYSASLALVGLLDMSFERNGQLTLIAALHPYWGLQYATAYLRPLLGILKDTGLPPKATRRSPAKLPWRRVPA